MINQSSSEVWINPCNRCERGHHQTPLKLDRSGMFHICSDALSCLRTIKEQGRHTYQFGASSRKQRELAFELAERQRINLHDLVKDELGLDDLLFISGKAMSAIIDALMNRQIKAQRAA